MLFAKWVASIGLASVMFSAADSLQLIALVGGLCVIAIAGLMSVRARSADLWRQAYEAEKALGESKMKELVEVKRHLTAIQAQVAVYEQAPKYEDVAALVEKAVVAMTSEQGAILDGMQKITAILGRMETRLTP